MHSGWPLRQVIDRELPQGRGTVPIGTEGEDARFYTFRYAFQNDGSRRFD